MEYGDEIISTTTHIPTGSSWIAAVLPPEPLKLTPISRKDHFFLLKDFSAGHFCQIAWPVAPCLVRFNNNNSNKTLQDVLSSLSGRINSSAKV